MNAEIIRYAQVFNTTCYACGSGCGVRIYKHKNGSLLLEGDPDHPINEGKLCIKGSDIKYSINDDNRRLKTPLVRFSKNTALKPASWYKTLTRVVAVMRTFIEKFGAESIAFYISEELLNEEYFLIQKLVREKIGSTQLYSKNLWSNKVSLSIQQSFGKPFKFASYSDLEFADCVLLISDLSDSHPVLWERIIALKASKPELKIISISSQKNEVSTVSNLHLQAFPGTEQYIYQAITRLLNETGASDEHFGSSENATSALRPFLNKTAKICGLDPADLEKASKWIAQCKNFISAWSEGDELYNSTSNKESLELLIELHFICGKINKTGSGPIFLMQDSNARGNWEIEKCFSKPISEFSKGHCDSHVVENKAAESLLLNLKYGKIKFLWLMGADILSEFPHPSSAEEALKAAKFLVYQGTDDNASVLNYADAAFPAAHRIEKEGTVFNASGGLSYSPKVNVPPADAWPDGKIISKFATSMGFSDFEYNSNEALFFELAKSLGIASPTINFSMLKKHKVIYPDVLNQAGSNQISIGGKGKTAQKTEENHFKESEENFPWYLDARIFRKNGCSAEVMEADNFKTHCKNTALLLNPEDAEILQIVDNDLVDISSYRGNVRVKANLSQNIKKGALYASINLEGTSKVDLNDWHSLLGSDSSPLAESVVNKVQLRKYTKEKQKIVIIGAGAAAYGFVKSYRKINKIDEIEIFSKEKTPFYDRFKLPEYLSGAHLWDQLLKMDKAEETSLNISIHRGMSILNIDRENKCIIDAENNKTAYDILIIATGSRAAKPKNTPKKAGIFTMRSRRDAENFRNNVPSDAEVVIVGGGILGLEVASSLREKGAKVTIIQRTSRFLDRQLDALGSQILHEEMIDLGCDIYYNDEVQLYFGQTTITGVGLKSGRKVPCQAMVLAIGNIPNIHLAKGCGLESKLGILVNTQLQTEDPTIFAIGEVAEVNGNVYNFPLAAEEQAVVAANFINGDRNSAYEGSLLRNTIKLQGREICSTGLVEAPDDQNYEEIIVLDKKKRYYKKCIVSGDRLVGAILIGDKSEFETFGELIANKVLLKDTRNTLLRKE